MHITIMVYMIHTLLTKKLVPNFKKPKITILPRLKSLKNNMGECCLFTAGFSREKHPNFSYFLSQFLKINMPAKVEKRPKCLLAPSRGILVTPPNKLSWAHILWNPGLIMSNPAWVTLSLVRSPNMAWKFEFLLNESLNYHVGLGLANVKKVRFVNSLNGFIRVYGVNARKPCTCWCFWEVGGGVVCVWANNVLLHFST